MQVSPADWCSREWVSLIAAVALGPAFLLIGYYVPGLVFGATAGAYILVCATVVPLLTLAAGRSKFIAWQTAIVSMALAVIGDNLRVNAMHGSEIYSSAYVFWAMGTLLSCPRRFTFC